MPVDSPPPGLRLRGRFVLKEGALFDGLDFQLMAGQWTCLLGSSGIGKSTVLRLLAGLPTGGVFTGSITASDGRAVAERVAYMAQSDLLAPWLDVWHNLLLGHRLRGETLAADRVHAILAATGLTAHADKRPAQLSGGMRQRVALARTLLRDASIVLLDEPFSALDARTRAEMQELAWSLLAGRTVLLVTHDPAEAARLGERIVLMERSGLKEVAAPRSAPIRAVDDAHALSGQAALMLLLRAGESRAVAQ